MNKQIADTDIRGIFATLTNILGEVGVGRAVRKHSKTWNHSGPIYREMFLRERHPWLDSLRVAQKTNFPFCLRDDEKAAVFEAASQACKVIDVFKTMPDVIKRKYRSDLLDLERASDYLFEIEIAYQMCLSGYGLQWEFPHSTKRPEFAGHRNGACINVECKSYSADAYRPIKTPEFCKFADTLLKHPILRGVCGLIRVNCCDVDSKGVDFDSVAIQVQAALVSRQYQSEIRCADTVTTIDVVPSLLATAPTTAMLSSITSTLGPEDMSLFLFNENGYPLCLTNRCFRKTQLLEGMFETLKMKGRAQLDPSVPGVLACKLAGVDDFSGLEKDSGLAAMVTTLLCKEGMDHVVALMFVGKARAMNRPGEWRPFKHNLFFKNRATKFKGVDLDFMGRVL